MFNAWVEDHGPGVLSYLRSMVRNATEADDIWQETFFKIHRSLDSYREQGEARGWIFKVARSCLTDHHRRNQRQIQVVPVQESDAMEMEGGPEVLGTRELAEHFERVIESLPHPQKEVFLLRQRQGMSFSEIEKITGEPKSRLLGRMHLAMKKLRQALPEETR